MAGQTPNSLNIGRVASGIANTTAVSAHPEFVYWRHEWTKLRDVVAGQREIKRKSATYLPRLKKQDDDDYEAYLRRAPFYNMTAQTLNGMIGEVFQRDPVIKNFPSKYKDTVRQKFGKDGSGHINFSKTIISEILTTGRYGVLVDISSSASIEPVPYALGYSAENIIDWDVQEVNGTFQPTRVLLREFVRSDQFTNSTGAQVRPIQVERVSPMVRASGQFVESYTYTAKYRELLLVQQGDGTYVYVQNVYAEDPNGTPYDTFTPTVRGATLNFIPFMFFGATSNTADVEKSPLLDIADLNVSHYQTYADLEWGRMFTALPVYYAPGRDDEGASEYNIGPSVVWEVPNDLNPPGILEYKGEGLKQLESALNTKERQIAAIGGRMMPGTITKGSESPEQSKRAQASEQALILNAIQVVEFGMTHVARWYLMWRDFPLSQTESVAYVLNRMFGDTSIGAREMRVMQQLYNDGIMPIEVVYAFSVKANWIDPEITEEDFKGMLENPDSFQNSPDAQARQRGFASRAQELDQVVVAREADMQQQEIDLEERQVVLEENAPPPPPPVVKAPVAAGPQPSKAKGPRTASPGGKSAGKAADKANK